MKYLIIISLLVLTFTSQFAQTTKFLTLNIRYDNKGDLENNWEYRKSKMVKLFDYYEPSIIGIQEGLINQIEYLDSCLANYRYIGVGRDDGMRKGEFSAIFFDTRKYNLLQDSTFWLSETPNKVSKGWDAALERICTYGLFEDKITKDRIWIFNTHFDHIGVLAREKSAELLIKKIEQINSENLPVILMGDFNVTPNEKPVQILKTALSDALEISQKNLYGPPGTFNGFKDGLITNRIDYFFTKDINVLSYAHIDDRLDNNRYVSDHLPVLLTIIK